MSTGTRGRGTAHEIGEKLSNIAIFQREGKTASGSGQHGKERGDHGDRAELCLAVAVMMDQGNDRLGQGDGLIYALNRRPSHYPSPDLCLRLQDRDLRRFRQTGEINQPYRSFSSKSRRSLERREAIVRLSWCAKISRIRAHSIGGIFSPLVDMRRF